MARNILIIDPSASMRRIIQTMVQANVNDAVISQAADHDEADRIIQQQGCHVLISTWESSDHQSLEFFQSIKGGGPNDKGIPIVAVVAGEEEKNMDRARQAGVVEHVVMPCTGEVLANAINRAFNPVQLRQSRRYSIPDTTAILEQGTGRIKADVVNVSNGGLLCELEYPGHLNCGMPMMITLLFKLGSEQLTAAGLLSSFTAMKVLARNSDYSPKRVRVSFFFITVPPATADILDRAFAAAQLQEEKLGS